MRGLGVALVGALVISLSLVGLMEHERRAGPWDVALPAAATEAEVEGTYHAQPFAQPTLGLCPQPPCAPWTSVDLLVRGLPPLPFAARLEGPAASAVALGPLVPEEAGLRLRWQDATDHQDKREIVLSLAGQDVARLAVRPSAQPMRIDGLVDVVWAQAPVEVRLNEIGGFFVSGVAKAVVPAPPAGWEFHAWLDGRDGRTHLGVLEEDGGLARLDARVEWLALEHQHRVTVALRPVGAAEDGLAAWSARLPPGAADAS